MRKAACAISHDWQQRARSTLRMPARALITPNRRRYLPVTGVMVPVDLVAHPFVILADDMPDSAFINTMTARYPGCSILHVPADGGLVLAPGCRRELTTSALVDEFGYRTDSGSFHNSAWDRWIKAGTPRCTDIDYGVRAAGIAHDTLVASGVSHADAMVVLAVLMLGLTAGPGIGGACWRQPELTLQEAWRRATALMPPHRLSVSGELNDLAAGRLPQAMPQLDAELLRQVAYRLAPVDWRCVSWDILGPIYTAGLAKEARRNGGVYFTPPRLVDLVLDASGVCNQDLAGDILEPCAGTGAFVVRLLARLRSSGGGSGHNAVMQLQRCLNHLTAIEPDPTAGLLLFLNVCTQWAIACADEPATMPDWQPVQADALQAYSTFAADQASGETTQPEQLSLAMFESLADRSEIDRPAVCSTTPASPAAPAPPDFPDIPGLPTSPPVQAALQKLQMQADFAYVLGNPPYIGESGHRRLFQAYRTHPFWRLYSEPKMDFLQYFIVLGLSKIQKRPGGCVCFLTSAYWLTADGAKRLRTLIMKQADIKDVMFIGGRQPLFGDAPGHHSAIVVLQGKIASGCTTAPTMVTHMALNADQIQITSTYPVPKDAMQNNPWYLQATVAELGALEALERCPRLAQAYAAKQGVAPGAQRIGLADLEELGKEWVAQHAIQENEGVFVLNQAEVAALHLPPAEAGYLRPFIKNSAIRPYGIDPVSLWLIYLRHDTVKPEDCPTLIRHLARFAPLLKRKREYHLGRRDWFHLHWPRDESIFNGEKIVTAGRGNRPAFAWTSAPLYAATDVYFITAEHTLSEHASPSAAAMVWPSLPVLTGILNSGLAWFWFAHRTKTKGSQREFFSNALLQFPLPLPPADAEMVRWRDAHARLEQYVYALHKRGAAASAEASVLKQVDAAVFELYHLSPEAERQIRQWLELQYR